MKRRWWLLFFLLVGCADQASLAEDQSRVVGVAPPHLRVMTFNILHAALGLDKVAALIRAEDPDVVHLQEVDVGAQRSGFVDQPAVLAEMTGLPYHKFDPVLDLSPGEYGTAFLSRYPIDEVLREELRPQGAHTRTLFVVDVATPDGVHRTGGTHISFLGHVQPGQILTLLVAAERAGVETVMGDFNFVPTSPLHEWMGYYFDDAWESVGNTGGATFPASAPANRIDYVFTKHGVRSAHVPNVVASDHLPVVVDL